MGSKGIIKALLLVTIIQEDNIIYSDHKSQIIIFITKKLLYTRINQTCRSKPVK